MRRASSPHGMCPFFLAALGVVVADQLTKLGIRASLLEGQSLFEAGFFRIVYTHNTGAAFGLFPGQSFALAILAILGASLLLVYALVIRHRFSPLNNLLAWTALGLVLGGIVGNLIDRLRLGAVTDFISLGWWPAFNIADSAVVVGGILFACSLLRLAKKHG
jgi:signal peptidase II